MCPTKGVSYYTGVSESPTKGVSLRCIDPEQYAIVDEGTGTVLEQIEGRKAFYQVYGEATHLEPLMCDCVSPCG